MTDEQIRLVRELRSGICRCGKPKKAGQSFCRADYFRLTREEQAALYRRLGAGYEEAYAAAVAHLWAEIEGGQ